MVTVKATSNIYTVLVVAATVCVVAALAILFLRAQAMDYKLF
jgi:hypothetical protein